MKVLNYTGYYALHKDRLSHVNRSGSLFLQQKSIILQGNVKTILENTVSFEKSQFHYEKISNRCNEINDCFAEINP